MATPVSSNYATLGLRNRHPVLKFDDTTVQEATFDSVMPQQFPGSMALTVKMVTSAETASAGSAVLGAAFERISGSLQDVDEDGFGGFVKGSVGTPVTSGETSIVTLKYKTGNQVKRLQPGDKFRLRVQRAATAGGDILDGNLELHSVEIRY
jgi:hypothetical protein